MAFVLKDRVRETSVTTGTGAFTLTGAIAGYQSFSSVMSVGDTCWYGIVLSATSWEIGIGTYSGADTLTRTTVIESSNSNSAVSFAAGTKDVFIGFPSSKMASLFDSSGAADQVRWNTVQSLTTGQKTQARSNIGLPGDPTGVFETGDGKFTLRQTASTGWVMANDGTIGPASSGATTRANDDTWPLFEVLWAIPNTYTPIFNSDGSTGTRGASAINDWTNNKRISLTKTLGRALVAAGAGSGLTSYALGQTNVGENTHSTTQSELPAVAPTFLGSAMTAGLSALNNVLRAAGVQVQSGPSALAGNDLGAGLRTDSFTPAGTISNLGSGVAHNNMQPSSFWNVMVKL